MGKVMMEELKFEMGKMTHEPKITILEPLLSFLRYEILMAESSASSFFTFRTMPRNLFGKSSELKQFDANVHFYEGMSR